jgi:hypothetical protein
MAGRRRWSCVLRIRTIEGRSDGSGGGGDLGGLIVFGRWRSGESGVVAALCHRTPRRWRAFGLSRGDCAGDDGLLVMSAPMQCPGPGKSRHARLLWLLMFMIIAGGLGVLLLRDKEPRPLVTFPDGSVFTFAGITKSTPRPPMAGVSHPGLRHVPPGDEPPSWWSKHYQQTWAASPDWLKRWLPAPRATTFIYNEEIWGWKYEIPKYSVWMEPSGLGSEFSTSDWSIDANCASRGWSLGAVAGTLVLDGKPVTPPPKIWLRVNLDSLPPEDTRHIRFKLTSEDGRNTVAFEIPNPNYEPAGR